MRDLSNSEPRLGSMSAAERGQFFDELFAVYDAIFDGYSRDELESNFSASEVATSRFQVFRNAAGSLVGFNGVRLYHHELLGGHQDVFRSIAGMLPEYRGGSSMGMFGLQIAIGHKIRHPFRSVYFFSAMLHPSVYYMLAKYAHTLWPCHDRRTPKHIDDLMSALADARKYEFDDPPSPYVRLARERTRQDDAEKDFWRTSEHPAIRFYVETNPRYDEGRGLITLIPLTWANLMISGARYAAAKLGRRLGRGTRQG